MEVNKITNPLLEDGNTCGGVYPCSTTLTSWAGSLQRNSLIASNILLVPASSVNNNLRITSSDPVVELVVDNDVANSANINNNLCITQVLGFVPSGDYNIQFLIGPNASPGIDPAQSEYSV